MIYTADQEIKAISIKQPFAALMLHGKIETRSWNTKYRGWVLLCSTQQSYRLDILEEICYNRQLMSMIDLLGKNFMDGLHIWQVSKAFAIGRLVDSRLMTVEDEDKCFVKFQEGTYCHIYEDVIPIKPMNWKGEQKWSLVPDSLKQSIEANQIIQS